jgi:hypothetical protein
LNGLELRGRGAGPFRLSPPWAGWCSLCARLSRISWCRRIRWRPAGPWSGSCCGPIIRRTRAQPAAALLTWPDDLMLVRFWHIVVVRRPDTRTRVLSAPWDGRWPPTIRSATSCHRADQGAEAAGGATDRMTLSCRYRHRPGPPGATPTCLRCVELPTGPRGNWHAGSPQAEHEGSAYPAGMTADPLCGRAAGRRRGRPPRGRRGPPTPPRSNPRSSRPPRRRLISPRFVCGSGCSSASEDPFLDSFEDVGVGLALPLG